MPLLAHQRPRLQKKMRKLSVSRVPWQRSRRCCGTPCPRGCIGEGARAIVAPIGQLDKCDKFCERAEKRVEKAQEAVAEALKVQTQREEELAEEKRRLEGLRAEAAAQPVPQPVIPGNDELTHLRSHVAQLEGDLRRQSHQFATEKISAETSLKQQVELLLQEVAALCLVLCVRGPRIVVRVC